MGSIGLSFTYGYLLETYSAITKIKGNGISPDYTKWSSLKKRLRKYSVKTTHKPKMFQKEIMITNKDHIEQTIPEHPVLLVPVTVKQHTVKIQRTLSGHS